LRILLLPALALAGSATAWADEPVFGFIYTTDLLPQGQKEIEQWLTWRHQKAGGYYDQLENRTEFSRWRHPSPRRDGRICLRGGRELRCRRCLDQACSVARAGMRRGPPPLGAGGAPARSRRHLAAFWRHRMTRARRNLIYAIGIGVWLSGVLWLVFHYFVSDQGSLGPVVSPFEVWSLTSHGAFAFAAIFIFGLLWGAHVPARWLPAQRRVSGGSLAGILGWLTVSGYFLYYAGGEEFRAAVSLAHWVVGLAAPLAFLAHGLKRRGTLPAASQMRAAALNRVEIAERTKWPATAKP
jgi:hypothetical protein